MDTAEDKRRKLRENDINLGDLPEYIRKKAVPGAKVYILNKGRWTKVGNFQLLVKSTGSNMDDAWSDIVAVRDVPFWNWLHLPIARVKNKAEFVLDWQVIPGTDIILDFYYIGDGTEGTPIAVQIR